MIAWPADTRQPRPPAVEAPRALAPNSTYRPDCGWTRQWLHPAGRRTLSPAISGARQRRGRLGKHHRRREALSSFANGGAPGGRLPCMIRRDEIDGSSVTPDRRPPLDLAAFLLGDAARRLITSVRPARDDEPDENDPGQRAGAMRKIRVGRVGQSGGLSDRKQIDRYQGSRGIWYTYFERRKQPFDQSASLLSCLPVLRTVAGRSKQNRMSRGGTVVAEILLRQRSTHLQCLHTWSHSLFCWCASITAPRRENLAWVAAGRLDSAGWPARLSRSLAAKGVGACLKHVLNTRLSSGYLVTRGGRVMQTHKGDRAPRIGVPSVSGCVSQGLA